MSYVEWFLRALLMVRLMAFVLPCIGNQIMWTGWPELNGFD